MSVIAVDTAARDWAWVLRADTAGAVVDCRRVPGGELDLRLTAAVADLLDSELEAVVVLTGPGSYTGVRAGMAAALGLAVARGVPLHGCGNLAAIAAAAPSAAGEEFMAVAGAGRGGVYVARFQLRDAVPTQLTAVERRAVTAIDAGVPLVATAPLEGLDATVIDPAAALAAAVPVALRAPALEPAGLSAIHAPATPR